MGADLRGELSDHHEGFNAAIRTGVEAIKNNKADLVFYGKLFGKSPEEIKLAIAIFDTIISQLNSLQK